MIIIVIYVDTSVSIKLTFSPLNQSLAVNPKLNSKILICTPSATSLKDLENEIIVYRLNEDFVLT